MYQTAEFYIVGENEEEIENAGHNSTTDTPRNGKDFDWTVDFTAVTFISPYKSAL